MCSYRREIAHVHVSRHSDFLCMLQALAVGARRIVMSTVTKKPEVLFILGGPGSGKGTLCRYIVERYGYVHLSAGDLLREERVKPGSQYGELIETHIRNGTIVPVEITCSLLDRAMHVSDNPHNRFLIDGFPRNQDNLDGWNKVHPLFALLHVQSRLSALQFEPRIREIPGELVQLKILTLLWLGDYVIIEKLKRLMRFFFIR